MGGIREDKWNGLKGRLFWCYKGPIPPYGNGPQGIANNYFAWLLLEGEAEFRFNRKEKVSLHAGEWGFPPLRATDRFHRFSEDARLLSLQFLVEWPGWRPLHPLRNFVKFSAAGQPRLEREARKLVQLCKGVMDYPLDDAPAPMDFARQAQIRGTFWTWLASWSEALTAQGLPPSDPIELDERLERMLELLERSETYQDVPYEKLMKSSSLGRVQIDRLFKSQLGFSPKHFLERHLLELCKTRLLSSGRSMKELALELRFPHASNFNAWFKRGVGMTPQNFRERGKLEH